MPLLLYETRKFSTTLAAAEEGRLSLPLAGLIWGAITVGMTPISMGGMPRPLIELCWRAALAGASLEEDPSSGRWAMTAAYQRLDPSEKRALSYFLGMTQAKITCERLLQAPHLIHLDAYLTMIGQPTQVSRPDLIGISLPSMDCTIAVEAKGRTRGRTDRVIRDAKKQVFTLPGVLSTSQAIRVASVASFDARGRWEAYLEDPPGPFRPSTRLTVGSVLAAYYRPLVTSLLTAGDSQTAAAAADDDDDDDDDMTIRRLPGIDLILGIPTVIVTIMRRLPPVGPVRADQLDDIGSNLRQVLTRRLPESLQGEREMDKDDSTVPRRSRSYTGLDGVYVGLGPTWQ